MKLIPDLTPIDQKAIHELGIPSLLLMEEAGRRVALRVTRLLEQRKLSLPVVTVVCGKGNNGGDGFVCARRLAMLGNCQVVVVHAVPESEMSGDTLTNFKLLKHHPISVISGMMVERVTDTLVTSDIVVDAIFGSGLSRPIEGHFRDLVNAVSDCGAFVVAVDLPSGVHSSTGKVLGCAVKADFTVTFAAPKPGLYLFPGKGYTGEVEFVDIGIPRRLMEEDASQIHLITPQMVRNKLPRREGLSHKFSYGTVLVIAGSRDMPGAAVMTAKAALASGAGIVILAAPESAFARMDLPPELICKSLPETSDGIISPEALQALAPLWNRVSTVAFGPGMTHQPPAVSFTEQLLQFLQSQFQGPVVIDADGLNCLSTIKPHPILSPRFILTPHLGECTRLTGLDKETVQNDLLNACQTTVQQYQATVVLKSASTVISDISGRQWINPTGNPGMATAGSGDILTGLVAGFLAQGLSADKATRIATYLHGLSGDKAAEALSPFCLTATHLIDYLPHAIQGVQNS